MKYLITMLHLSALENVVGDEGLLGVASFWPRDLYLAGLGVDRDRCQNDLDLGGVFRIGTGKQTFECALNRNWSDVRVEW